MAEIRVDKTGFDAAVLADHEGCGYRQKPPALALKLFEIDAELPVGVLDLIADPEDETERERIRQIEVGQHPERQTTALLEGPGIFRRLRHDRDHLAARSGDLRIGAGERMQLEPAIVAPRPAVEADDERPSAQERDKIDDMPLAVGHQKIGQSFADGGNENIGAVGLNARGEIVVGRFEIGKKLAGFSEIEFQPLVERTSRASALSKASARASSSDLSL